MTRAVIPVNGQGDALPSGEHVVLVPEQHMLFNGAIIPFPPGERYGVLYPVLSADGKKFAGQGHDTKSTWEWIGEWIQHPPSNGTYGHIYDLQGNLHIIAPGPDVTSQGYRNVANDGTFVMGDDTYTPKHGVSQRTEIEKDLIIGQGHDDAVSGVVAWDGANLRRIDTGFCWPVRARWQGDRVALTYTRSGEGVVIRQTTKQELRTLTIISPPAPAPSTTPPPTPKPEPKPIMRLPDSVQTIVEALYAKHKDLAEGADDQRRQLAKKIAETTCARVGSDWGWKSADISRPPSKDAIAKKDGAKLYGFDLFNGATRKPNDHPEGEDITGQHFIDVQPVDHLSDPQPNPLPAPPTQEPTEMHPGPDAIAVALASIMLAVGDLREEIAKLRIAVEAVKVEQVGMWGTAAIPLLGTARVDLQPGVRPQTK